MRRLLFAGSLSELQRIVAADWFCSACGRIVSCDHIRTVSNQSERIGSCKVGAA